MNPHIELILFDAKLNVYLLDDDTGQTTKDLQKAMIVRGQTFGQSIQKKLVGYDLLQIHRPNPQVPHYIAIVQFM